MDPGEPVYDSSDSELQIDESIEVVQPTSSSSSSSSRSSSASNDIEKIKWNEHQKNLIRFFGDLANNPSASKLCDVTLACDDGYSVRLHKLILSANSRYFRHVFEEVAENKHPVIILSGIKGSILKLIVDFIYTGKAQVSPFEVLDFIAAGNALGVQGIEEPASKTSIGWTSLPKNGAIQVVPSSVAATSSCFMLSPISDISPTKEQLEQLEEQQKLQEQQQHQPQQHFEAEQQKEIVSPSSGLCLLAQVALFVGRKNQESEGGSSNSEPINLSPFNKEQVEAIPRPDEQGKCIYKSNNQVSANAAPSPSDHTSGSGVSVKYEPSDCWVNPSLVVVDGSGVQTNPPTKATFWRIKVPDSNKGIDLSMGRSTSRASITDHHGYTIRNSPVVEPRPTRPIVVIPPPQVSRVYPIVTPWAQTAPHKYSTLHTPSPHLEQAPKRSKLSSPMPSTSRGSATIQLSTPEGMPNRRSVQSDPLPVEKRKQKSASAEKTSQWKSRQPEQCEECHKTFSNKFNKKQHWINMHSTGGEVNCDLCGKELKNKWYMRRHIVTHHNAPLRRVKGVKRKFKEEAEDLEDEDGEEYWEEDYN